MYSIYYRVEAHMRQHSRRYIMAPERPIRPCKFILYSIMHPIKPLGYSVL